LPCVTVGVVREWGCWCRHSSCGEQVRACYVHGAVAFSWGGVASAFDLVRLRRAPPAQFVSFVIALCNLCDGDLVAHDPHLLEVFRAMRTCSVSARGVLLALGACSRLLGAFACDAPFLRAGVFSLAGASSVPARARVPGAGCGGGAAFAFAAARRRRGRKHGAARSSRFCTHAARRARGLFPVPPAGRSADGEAHLHPILPCRPCARACRVLPAQSRGAA
jgi:hypothetical protein